MIVIYGIKNCDTMQKAFKWLDANKIKYQFHNYKESGIDTETIKSWLQYIPLEKIINTKGTTFRNLSETDKASLTTKSKAIKVMIANPSMIKRPILNAGNHHYLVGFSETEYESIKKAV